MKVSGINNIVALSSIQVNRGHSEATKIAEINGAIAIGVSTKIEQSIQMKKEATYPIFITAFEENFALLNWGNTLTRVLSFGRQGLIVPDNIHHTLAMGWDAAHSLNSNGTFNTSQWDEALRRFEGHVVED